MVPPFSTVSVNGSAPVSILDALLCTAERRCLASCSAGKAPTWIIQPLRSCGLAGGGCWRARQAARRHSSDAARPGAAPCDRLAAAAGGAAAGLGRDGRGRALRFAGDAGGRPGNLGLGRHRRPAAARASLRPARARALSARLGRDGEAAAGCRSGGRRRRASRGLPAARAGLTGAACDRLQARRWTGHGRDGDRRVGASDAVCVPALDRQRLDQDRPDRIGRAGGDAAVARRRPVDSGSAVALARPAALAGLDRDLARLSALASATRGFGCGLRPRPSAPVSAPTLAATFGSALGSILATALGFGLDLRRLRASATIGAVRLVEALCDLVADQLAHARVAAAGAAAAQHHGDEVAVAAVHRGHEVEAGGADVAGLDAVDAFDAAEQTDCDCRSTGRGR